MALSASELLQLQQSLAQLARASSNIASFATQMGNVQSTSITTAQTETKLRRTVIDDYNSLSKTLQNQSKEFKDVLKNVNDFSASVTDIKNKHDAVADKLNTLQAAITAAGTATTQQITRQNRLTTLLDRYSERLNTAASAEKNKNVNQAIIDLVESTAQAAKYRSEYEKDFYGRQLASEIKSSLSNITNQIGGKFGKQLLELTDVSQIAGFAEAQYAAIQSIINNNKKLDDSNADLINNYIKLGKSLGYTSTEFDFLAAHLDARTAGTSIDISQSSIDSLNTAQETIATVINDSNEKLGQTIDKDFRSFGGQIRAYMYENRNGFDKLFDELSDIKTRHGSLTSGAGGDAASEALHAASGMIGREIIPRMTEILKIMGNYYTKEYDSLTNYVQTNRMTALQLNMTEDQYRRSRTESKAVWNIAAESGQQQLDEYLTSRRLKLESVYGTEPELRDKMGQSFYNLTQLFNVGRGETDKMITDFGKLSLVSRMSSTELTDMFNGLNDSNENMRIMNGLDEKGRQLRIKENLNTVKLVSSLGLAGEAAQTYAKALMETPTKSPEVADVMSAFGSVQVMVSQMTNLAKTLNLAPALTAEEGRDYGALVAAKKQGSISQEDTERLNVYDKKVADFMNAAGAARQQIMNQQTGSYEKMTAPLAVTNQITRIEEMMKSAGIENLIDPIRDQSIASQKYNETQKDLIVSVDSLRKAMERQAEEANRRADDIKVPKVITGVAAEGQRFFDALGGNMWTEILNKIGIGALGAVALKKLAPMILPEIAGLLGGGAIATIAAPILAVLGIGGAAYGAYNYFHREEPEATETKEPIPDVNKQTQEAPKRVEPVPEAPMTPTTPLPSGKLEEAETSAAAAALNEQFTKYFNSVDVQNTMMVGFLRQLANNSDVLGKDIKDWYESYQDINSIVPIAEGTTKKKSGDASATPG